MEACSAVRRGVSERLPVRAASYSSGEATLGQIPDLKGVRPERASPHRPSRSLHLSKPARYPVPEVNDVRPAHFHSNPSVGKPSQFRSVSEACRGLRTEFRPFSRILRLKSPASLCPQNSVSRTTRVRRRRAFYGGEADERQRLGAIFETVLEISRRHRRRPLDQPTRRPTCVSRRRFSGRTSDTEG